MARDISIVFSAKDNYSASLKKMIEAQREMTASGAELQSRLDRFNKTKYGLKLDLDRAKQELKEATRALDNTGEAAQRLENAQVSCGNITSQLKLVTKAANDTQRAMENASGAISKQENRAGSAGRGIGGLGTSLGQAGAYQMLGSFAAEAAGVFVQSAFGDEATAMLSSTLSSAASGAAIGTMIAPGIGTAIGAAAGGLLGAFTGQMQLFEKKDEAFKGVLQERVQHALAAQDEAAASGSVTAASREMAQMSFTTLFQSENEARDYLAEMQNYANVTPFQFEDLTGLSKTLATYQYGRNELKPTIEKIGDAGAALGMGTSDMNMVATALGRMKSSGKTSLEYVNLLQERGIDAIGYLSQGMGIDRAAVYEKISKNLIDGAEAAECIADYMGQAFSGSMEKQAESYTGLLSTVEGLTNSLNAAMGEGYNDERKKGLTEQIKYLQGSGMEEDYKLIGQWKASLENEHDAAVRQAMEDAKETADYRTAQAEGDGAKMGEALARARVKAEAEYQAGEGYQEFFDMQKKLITDVRDDQALNDAYWDTGYRLGMEFSKGMKAAQRKQTSTLTDEQIEEQQNRIDKATAEGRLGLATNGYAAMSIIMGPDFDWNDFRDTNKMHAAMSGHAYGLGRVPYDGYPALLHEGERVLTAQEVRSGSPAPNIQITVNGLTVREEADVSRIAAELCREIQMARTAMA